MRKSLWLRSEQFHPRLWDCDDPGRGYYAMYSEPHLNSKNKYKFNGRLR